MNGTLILAVVLSVVISYLLGSCNSAILVGNLIKHQDIRTLGSHNAGLTNTLRCFGKGCALLTLIGDLAKGIVAVLLCKLVCNGMGVLLAGDESLQFIGYVAGMAAILGHVFPLYYHFKGGKGVLVGVSVFVVIDWKTFCLLILIFAIVLTISKYVSLSSMVAAACCPLVTLGMQLLTRPDQALWYTLMNTAFAAMMGAWIIWMHRSNIERLRTGTENRFSFHKSEEQSSK